MQQTLSSLSPGAERWGGGAVNHVGHECSFEWHYVRSYGSQNFRQTLSLLLPRLILLVKSSEVQLGPFKGSLSSAGVLSSLVTGVQGLGTLEATENPLDAIQAGQFCSSMTVLGSGSGLGEVGRPGRQKPRDFFFFKDFI